MVRDGGLRGHPRKGRRPRLEQPARRRDILARCPPCPGPARQHLQPRRVLLRLGQHHGGGEEAESSEAREQDRHGEPARRRDVGPADPYCCLGFVCFVGSHLGQLPTTRVP